MFRHLAEYFLYLIHDVINIFLILYGYENVVDMNYKCSLASIFFYPIIDTLVIIIP